jgi:hypothetical protein
MYVNTLDTSLCMYFHAKNTKDHSHLESRLEILVSKRELPKYTLKKLNVMSCWIEFNF